MINTKSDEFKYNLLIVTISIGVVAGVMSSSMINLVMGEVASTFNVSFSASFWRNTLFFTFFSSSLVFFGRAADIIENKLMYLAGISLFCFSCALTFLAIHLKLFNFFLFTQSLQGVADAIILSAQMTLIRNLFPSNKLGWAFGIFTATLSSAALFAPVVGGLITKYSNWSNIFIFQIIISLVSLYMGYKYIILKGIKTSQKFENKLLSYILLIILMLSIQLLIINDSHLLEKIAYIFACILSLFLLLIFDKKTKLKFFPEEIC